MDIQLTFSDVTKAEATMISTTEPGQVFEGILTYGGYPSFKFDKTQTYDQQIQSFTSNAQERMAHSLLENEIVLPSKIIAEGISFVYCVIDYPLEEEAYIKVSFPSPKSITNYELLAIHAKVYQYIYEIENTTFPDPGTVPGMLNRAKSHGKYGIWGHYLEDLIYNSSGGVKIYNNFIFCEFDVDS
ncbi:hypothetical protein CYY_003344 [Polysphondylium violaceum]|uniref:Uncharacterized protein n=1 Tax=Polysphondylium violaceum TaxID=133409 RepID=A0A8J4PWK7_9MYCE|nr:hypothetical protein CYY_003344 [Polysphondylium violaceum]